MYELEDLMANLVKLRKDLCIGPAKCGVKHQLDDAIKSLKHIIEFHKQKTILIDRIINEATAIKKWSEK